MVENSKFLRWKLHVYVVETASLSPASFCQEGEVFRLEDRWMLCLRLQSGYCSGISKFPLLRFCVSVMATGKFMLGNAKFCGGNCTLLKWILKILWEKLNFMAWWRLSVSVVKTANVIFGDFPDCKFLLFEVYVSMIETTSVCDRTSSVCD